MEEEVSGGGSRIWEEEMYWKHFQFTHFSQFLLPGYNQKLAMPDTFCGNQKKKLPERVTLKGPGGDTWEVGLTTNSGTLFFDVGWADFVKDHGLKENDLLVFKYNGVSHFEVLIFNGKTLCENAPCYFVKKSEPRCLPKRKLGGNSPGPDVTFATPIDKVKPTSVEKTAEKYTGTVPSSRPVKHHIIWEATNVKASNKRKKNSNGPILVSDTENSEELSSSAEMDQEQDVENTPLSFDVVHDVPYISVRKLVTGEEKWKALQLAKEAVSSDGFYVVMKPSHVYKRFFMSIPIAWISRHMNMLLKCPVILKIKDKTWKTKFSYQECRKSGGLSAGWKSFAVDNSLDESDICVFEPDAPFCTTIVLDVDIIRVVQDN